MAVTNFIPELWSGRILKKLEKSLVFGALFNTDYEGEIAEYGDTVRINAVGPVSNSEYVPGTTTITYADLTDEQQLLLIDQCRYFSFKVDDVDARQAKGNVMASGMDNAAYSLRDTADQYLASLWASAGSISADTDVNSLNAYEALLALAEALDEANVPSEGRWAVIPPWFKTKLVIAEILVENTTNNAWTNGMVGRAAGFDLHVSNNVDTNGAGTHEQIMAGTRAAGTFAQQIIKTEAIRLEGSFGDGVRGLHVYGAKIVQPDCLAVGSFNEIAEP